MQREAGAERRARELPAIRFTVNWGGPGDLLGAWRRTDCCRARALAPRCRTAGDRWAILRRRRRLMQPAVGCSYVGDAYVFRATDEPDGELRPMSGYAERRVPAPVPHNQRTRHAVRRVRG